MRWHISPKTFILYLSKIDTEQWAMRWPCSTLSGRSVRVYFDQGGLIDLTINGRQSDCNGAEISAMVADFIGNLLPTSHPAYFVAVGQFK